MFVTLGRSARVWLVVLGGLVAVLALGRAALPWQRGEPVAPAARAGGDPVRPTSGAPAPGPGAGAPGGRGVALTFDVLEGDAVVVQVLDVLAWRRVPATFFVTLPWAQGHRELVRRMIDEGHEVGLREPPAGTLRRASEPRGPTGGAADAGRSAEAGRWERAAAALARLTGRPVRFVRLALVGLWAGERDRTGGADAGAPDGGAGPGSAAGGSLRAVLWTLDLQDWMNPGVDYVVYRAQAAQPGDVLLLQASDFARQTPRALPRVLDALAARGLEPVALHRLLAPPAPEGPSRPRW